jgi:hypothetical protein
MSCVPSEATRAMQYMLHTLTRIQEHPLLAHDRTSNISAICHAVCPMKVHTRHELYTHILTCTAIVMVGSNTTCNTLSSKATLSSTSERHLKYT